MVKVAGFEILVDPRVPPDEIHFVQDQIIVGRITNIDWRRPVNPQRGVVLFTVIEILTMVLWLAAAEAGGGLGLVAVGILTVGLYIEHLVSYNVGTGQRPFAGFPFGLKPPGVVK